MLIVLTTHPIQYQIPLWRALAASGRVPFEVWYLSDHGVRAGYDVEFGKSFAWDFDMVEGYPHRFLSRDPSARVNEFWSTGLPAEFYRLLDRDRVSAVWIQGWQVRAYWQATKVAWTRGIPVWLRGESNDLGQVPFAKRAIKRAALGWLFRRVSRFLVIGTANARLYSKYGVAPEVMEPAPYCVDNIRFRDQADRLRPLRGAIRHQWGIPDDAFCPLFVGKFIPKKRPLDLILAAERLGGNLDGRPFHPLFAGSGELGAALRHACYPVFDAEAEHRRAEGAGVGAGQCTASFTGFLNQTEISAAYVAADCLVLPSDANETWGLVVNEAMASGVPCVVSAACGCASDLVAPLCSEYVFPLGDIDGMVRSLHALARARPSSERLWEQVEGYNSRISVESVIKLYESAS